MDIELKVTIYLIITDHTHHLNEENKMPRSGEWAFSAVEN